MKIAHVIVLNPTPSQAKALARAVGVARFVWNWALAEWRRQYVEGLKPCGTKIKKQWNAIKREMFPWVMESPRDANSQPFADLQRAYKEFFKSCKGERGKKVGPPQFKKKGQSDAFYVANDKFHFTDDGHVVLPVIGPVKIRESLRWQGKILAGRVRRRAGRWFLSVQVECEARRPTAPIQEVVGVDLGLKSAAVLSTGEVIESPKPLRSALVRLRRANRCLHRRKKGGSNRRKARLVVARIHERAACVRRDFWNKVTTNLCRENQAVVIEDLLSDFMRKNQKLSRAAADLSPGTFRRMMDYKGLIFGCDVVVADRFFPSTQRCSRCGHVKHGDEKVVLGESVYLCNECGLTIDRDLNAALNLEQYPRLEGNWRSARRTRTPTDDQGLCRPEHRRQVGSMKWESPREDSLVLTN